MKSEAQQHLEFHLLGERIIGDIPGVRVRKHGVIGVRAIAQLAHHMALGRAVCWSLRGDRVRVWIIPSPLDIGSITHYIF